MAWGFNEAEQVVELVVVTAAANSRGAFTSERIFLSRDDSN
jgi:hypothetical protein